VSQIWAEVVRGDLFPKDDSTKSELKVFKKCDSLDNPVPWVFPGSSSRDFPKDGSTKSELRQLKKMGSFDNPEFWAYDADTLGTPGAGAGAGPDQMMQDGAQAQGEAGVVPQGVAFQILDSSPGVSPIAGGVKVGQGSRTWD